MRDGAIGLQQRYRAFLFDRALLTRADDTGPGTAIRVLIVEDEALVALDIESALAAAGFAIVGVVDTEREAIREAQRLSPDVVIMDITLREGDGIAAARGISGGPCIIFVSGNSDPATRAEADKTAPAAFVNKPFSADDLTRTVLEAWRRRRAD